MGIIFIDIKLRKIFKMQSLSMELSNIFLFKIKHNFYYLSCQKNNYNESQKIAAFSLWEILYVMDSFSNNNN